MYTKANLAALRVKKDIAEVSYLYGTAKGKRWTPSLPFFEAVCRITKLLVNAAVGIGRGYIVKLTPLLDGTLILLPPSAELISSLCLV